MVKKKLPAETETVEIIDGQEMQKDSLDMEYNQKTRESYIKNSLNSDITSNLDLRERTFLGRCDTAGKYPVKRILTRLVRLKWRDPETRVESEYLVYYENWLGKDFMGRRVPVVADHMEGEYLEQEREPQIEYSPKGPIRKGWVRSGQHKVYYIPFSKETVDKIIEKADDTYRDELRYCVKFSDTSRDDRFTYDQFVKPWSEVYKLSNRKGGPQNPSPYLGTEDVLKTGIT